VTPATPYSYRVRAVDDSLNKSALSAALNVTTGGESEKPGFLKFEAYTGMEAATGFPSSPIGSRRRNKPTLVSYTPRADSRPVYPDDTHEQYGGVLSGWVTPGPVSGAYTFFLRSDDASELWLSTTDKAADLVKIAEQTGCCNAFTEPDPANPGTPAYTSLPINLVAGQKYYVQLLYKEGGGGDYGQVAWRMAGDTTPAGIAQSPSRAPTSARSSMALGRVPVAITSAAGAGHRDPGHPGDLLDRGRDSSPRRTSRARPTSGTGTAGRSPAPLPPATPPPRFQPDRRPGGEVQVHRRRVPGISRSRPMRSRSPSRPTPRPRGSPRSKPPPSRPWS
jgi:hypothetical protein